MEKYFVKSGNPVHERFRKKTFPIFLICLEWHLSGEHLAMKIMRENPFVLLP